jgi:3'(2'), 5'-bisphosphate nucleotidase/inositol polyphosphate 1-phosphatase
LRVVESFEAGHHDHALGERVAAAAGVDAEAPVRVDSMVKYAMLARRDAALYLRFPRAGYAEKVWDHAAGCVVLEEAGGSVKDKHGASLDFTHGRFLSRNEGIVASAPGAEGVLTKALDTLARSE